MPQLPYGENLICIRSSVCLQLPTAEGQTAHRSRKRGNQRTCSVHPRKWQVLPVAVASVDDPTDFLQTSSCPHNALFLNCSFATSFARVESKQQDIEISGPVVESMTLLPIEIW